MSKRMPTIALASLLAACASGPVTPTWKNNAHQSLENFSTAYLTGETRLAEAEFQRARSELARTGRFELVARAELTRCAAQVASLEFNACPGFAPLAADSGIAERHYADFLAGQPVSLADLPPPYQASSLQAMDAPLSRLIAAGVLLRRGQLKPADIPLIIDTAAAQGWRRPLLAWLEIQAQQAEHAGDAETAQNARRRAELVGGLR